MGVAGRAVSACDGVAQSNFRLRQERGECGDRNDRHLGDERIEDRLQIRQSQSEMDAPARFCDGTICRNERGGPRSGEDGARASSARGGDEDRRVDDERARRRPHRTTVLAPSARTASIDQSTGSTGP